MADRLTVTASAGAWVPDNQNSLAMVKFHTEDGSLDLVGDTSQKS